MWMERFRRRYAATERSDVRVEGKKENERRIKHLFPSSSRDNYRKAFNPKSYKSILWEETELRFNGALWFVIWREKRFSLSVCTFFRLMVNCSKCLNVSFACRRVDTCARVTYLLTPNKYTTKVDAEALKIGMAPLKLSLSPHSPSPPL